MGAVSVRLLVGTKGLPQNSVVSVDEAKAAALVADGHAVVVPSPRVEPKKAAAPEPRKAPERSEKD